MCTFCCVRY